MFIKETTQDTSFLKKKSINCNGKLLKLDEPLVMGVLNLTPDSFFDGGKYCSEEKIIEHVLFLIKNGADIIDLGGYSSRPGAIEISYDEEKKRVLPILKLLKKLFPEIVISIDTFRSKIAEDAIKSGASIVNDISAGDLDSKMLELIADLQVPFVAMHMQGTPKTMQEKPNYQNVTIDILNYFDKKINLLNQKGVHDVIIDPGFGFGKTVENNFTLLKNLHCFGWFGLPLLVGLSRKSMITKPLQINSSEALNGTTALNSFALMKGANILRVHDVKEAKETIELYKLMQKS
ncbi:MAG: dihydropteroate synthase [Flavobacteriales bacterium]|nr:dihydropteroate synthase [Flavobacteriales bacterium]